MTNLRRWIIGTGAVLLTALSMPVAATFVIAPAQGQDVTAPPRSGVVQKKPAQPRGKTAPAQPPATTTAQPHQLPARTPFTAADEVAATIPGIPDARFWADSIADFNNALPPQPGPWLALSSGGSDGAFGAGLMNGLAASGRRLDYSVITGVSAGALMAPFIFAGSKYDDQLRDVFTKITAADVFEAGSTGESFVDTWPLKDLVAKMITPAVLADVATAHRSGRRLFVLTTDLDAERSVVWNMGAIAAHSGDDALELFRTVLLASSAIPGAFPPVRIGVEANGKRFEEMHVDGGVGGQFFVAPLAMTAATSDDRLPATAFYVVANTGLQPDFQVVERSTPMILAQAVGTAVKNDTRLMMDRIYLAAKRMDVPFNVATIPPDFSAVSRGAFDPKYMTALFQAGYDLGKSAAPFRAEPPPYPAPPMLQPSDPPKAGASR